MNRAQTKFVDIVLGLLLQLSGVIVAAAGLFAVGFAPTADAAVLVAPSAIALLQIVAGCWLLSR